MRQLTAREKEIALLVADGFRNRAIATKLNIADRTVDRYRSRIHAKIAGSGIAMITRYVIKQGWIEP